MYIKCFKCLVLWLYQIIIELNHNIIIVIWSTLLIILPHDNNIQGHITLGGGGGGDGIDALLHVCAQTSSHPSSAICCMLRSTNLEPAMKNNKFQV